MANAALIALLLVLFYRQGQRLDRIEKKLRRIADSVYALLEPVPNRIAIYPNHFNKEETKMILKDSQKLPMSIAAVDKFGNPAGAFDAAPAWSVVDPTLGVLTVAADGLSAEFLPSGVLGTSQVQVAALASGHSIVGSLDISVVAGDAVSIQIQAGAPVDV